MAIGEAGSDLRHHVEEHTDRVAPADRVPELLEVSREPLGVHPLNDVHAGVVKGLFRSVDFITYNRREPLYLDGLMNLSLSGIIMCVVKPVTPMTKVRGNHKTNGRILQ